MKKQILLTLITIISLNVYSQHITLDSVDIIFNTKVNSNSLNSTTLKKDQLDRLPTNTIVEALSYIPNANIQQRGILGSQADISLRGGTYEQVALFFNGIKLNNPQTGHNNMMFPLPFESIDRIDVIKSGSSKYFGANAYAGAISINTLQPKTSSTSGNFSLGSFQTVNGFVQQDWVAKKHWHRLSASALNSDGYRDNTDMQALQFFSENHFTPFKNEDWDIYGTVGVNSKKFGANGFYALTFPKQYEELQSYFYNIGIKNRVVKLDAYWNQVNDQFQLKRENPSFYQNIHHTDIRGIMASLSKNVNESTRFNLSADAKNEAINSTNLGVKNRNTLNINANMDYRFSNKLKINLGTNLNFIENFDQFITGGLNIQYNVTPDFLLYSSYNSAFRVPTFTELYYTSPTDSGNNKLKPETSRTFDIGAKYGNNVVFMSINGYMRWSDNLIDWTKSSPTATFFQANNIGKVRTSGIEGNFSAKLSSFFNAKPIENFEMHFAHNEFSSEAIGDYRYNFNLLRNQAISSLTLKLCPRIYQTFSLRVEDRTNLNYIYALLDSKTEYHIKGMPVIFYLNVMNLTNSSYEYFNGLPMPSIYFNSGVRFKI